MSDADQIPQLYLITPPAPDLALFPGLLSACMDAVPVACLRLALAGRDEDTILRAADACREAAHARDVAIVIESHVGFVERLGLDGVHLTDGARSVRQVRKDLGGDAIIGTACGQSRHDGMTAGEIGADYVSFGPLGQTGLGDGRVAELELFQWWSQMIEVPVVAEGALSEDLVRAVAPFADFLAFGEEIWSAPDPVATLRRMHKAMGG
jgi:thiamine-phosphate pyrophosphorylase